MQKTNNATRWIIGLIVVALISFYAGTMSGSKPAPQAGFGGQYGASQSGGVRSAGRGGMGGFVSGSIVSIDQNSMTLNTQNGSSKIVFFATSTEVMKSAVGSISDLSANTNVVVTGSTNADGSVTASSIQIRPARPQQPAGQ